MDNIISIVFMSAVIAVCSYGVYHFYIKQKLFERAHKEEIDNFTTKIMVRARPFRDNCLLSDPDSIKYDVYVFNDFKSYMEYLEKTKYDDDPKKFIKLNESDRVIHDTSFFDFFRDSTFDTLEHAKERAQTIKNKLNEPNIYTESAKFNSKEIKSFNKKLNGLTDEDLIID